jgi:hypothetical protein
MELEHLVATNATRNLKGAIIWSIMRKQSTEDLNPANGVTLLLIIEKS